MVEFIHFNQSEFLEGDDLQERFGLRGRNMFQLAQIKVPIAPGFMFDSATVTSGALKEQLKLEDLEGAVKKIEGLTGKTFNAPERPMLFKVVVSPSIQIGTIRSVHTVGINDEVAAGFAKFCGEDFAYHEYLHFMESFGSRFLGKKAAEFKTVIEANPKASHKQLCEAVREKVVPDFPQNGYEQLRRVLVAMNEQYLDDPMNEGIEAGMVVQMMVYANFGENSYNGNFYSRDIVTGEARLSGFFGHNEFDTLPEDGTDINELPEQYLKDLRGVATLLEEKFLDIRQIKFVIEENTPWLVEQNPVDAKSTQAELRTLLDLHRRGLISQEKLVTSVPPAQLQDLLHPVIDYASTEGMPKIVGGQAGSPGAAVARVAFSTRTLLEEYHRCTLAGINANLILVMPHTDAEDVEAIELGAAVIASEGGYASHAPVVARSLRKPCLLYEDIEYKGDHIIMGGQRINELDMVSIEVPTYTEPTVWLGEARLVYPDTSQNGLEEFTGALSALEGDFEVLASAGDLADVETSLKLGAEGIGLFPMDNLLNAPEVLPAFREALLVPDPEARKAALAEVEKQLQAQVLSLFETLGGKPVVLRLLESPLADFLPHTADEQGELYKALQKKHSKLTVEDLKERANQLRNINPMLGLRGSRIAISYPDLYEVQMAAILRAAVAHADGGKNQVRFDLLVPVVMGDAEMRFIRNGRNIEGTIIRGLRGVEKDLLEELKLSELPFSYKIGASIELPAAALMAGHLAKQSEFFTIDTNMLTQTTNGMSYDDVNMFLPSYTQYDILKDNPFQILSTPVKQLIGTAAHFGKITRPDLRIGLQGHHASDPANIDFAFATKLNFVTCTPYGVPIAKLAVAQHLLKAKGAG